MAWEHSEQHWTRFVWRLTRHQEIYTKAALWTMNARAMQSKAKKGDILPTQQQLACFHPACAQWTGGNQHANYTICRECQLYLEYAPKGSRSSGPLRELAKGAKDILQPVVKMEMTQQRPVQPKQGYVRTPPTRSVEQSMEQALAPLVKAQAAQQQELDLQRQAMAQMMQQQNLWMQQQNLWMQQTLLPMAHLMQARQVPAPSAGSTAPGDAAEGWTLPPAQDWYQQQASTAPESSDLGALAAAIDVEVHHLDSNI